MGRRSGEKRVGRGPARVAAVLARAAAIAVAGLLTFPVTSAGARTMVDIGPPFGRVELIDEVRCAEAPGDRPFAEHPAGASTVQTILGSPSRVLPAAGQTGPAYFAYKLGAGKGLQPGDALVLAVEYPEDVARTVQIVNRGNESFQGFHTGAALGDSLLGYVGSNAESLQVPLSGRYRTWRQLFFLFDRFYGLARKRDERVRPDTPDTGFWVSVVRLDPGDDPASAGPAVRAIRLYRVPDVTRLFLQLRRPPEPLPRRHVFTREEMADGYADSPRGAPRGVENMARFFEDKARNMRFLGIDTFGKDLLEFGHNQGWDASDDAWYVPSDDPQRWERIVETATRHGLYLLPYYEYPGSMGLNRQVRCLPLTRDESRYTHVWWSELYHLDVTDPRSVEDARRLLDATITRFRDRGRFVGAWFRKRVSHWPVSFAEGPLGRFSREANAGAAVTREQLRADRALLDRYLEWWLGKRKEFLIALRDHLRASIGPNALVFWTNWNSEAGPLWGNGRNLVTDDPERWRPLLPQGWEVRDFGAMVASDEYLRSLTRWLDTWGTYEWQHSEPRADPERYRNTDGILWVYPFLRAFTVARPSDMDAFRGPSGLAAARMFPLNEHRAEPLGDYLSDVERTGPHSVLAEARLVANGDPFYIAYLHGNTHSRGFPEYVRRFHAAFLALPALPSVRLPDACADPEVVVRHIATPGGLHGDYFVVVNTGLTPKARVTIRLPVARPLTDAATGRPVASRAASGGRTVTLSLDACEVRSLHAAPAAAGARRR
ncbi:MAG TPA: hypothetical protein VLH79_16265 [Chthonomonadales bacterium]|nr:hypothetical protein [Chthonomonadales bacterium]